MRLVAVAFFSLILGQSILAQSESNDPGVRDTLSLNVSISDNIQANSVLSLEVWVYSDELIISFAGEFYWDNPNLRLDSADISSHLLSEDFSYFLYDNDDIHMSNLTKTIQLGGFTIGEGLKPDQQSRRLWATYHFTITDWQPNDSIKFDVSPEPSAQLMFVRMGPFYPVGFQPSFGGPMKLPGLPTRVLPPDQALPKDFVLYQNYPNPFNPRTRIQFELEKSATVDLTVYNLLGQKISTIHHGRLAAGLHQFDWNSKTATGQELPSGIYLYRLETEESVGTKKMIFLR